MLIDMHCHVQPESFPAPGGRPGAALWPRVEAGENGTRLISMGRGKITAQPVYFEVDRRLEAMDRHEVDAEVVSPLPTLLNYGFEAGDALDYARAVADFIARLCEKGRGRLFGLGTLPMQDPDLAAKALADVRQMGLHGVELASNVHGVSLGDERFLGFFQEAERLGVPIFVHSLGPTFAERLPANAQSGFATATEISLCAASLIMGGTAEKCPKLRLAFSHGGGGMALMLTREQFFWSQAWDEGARIPGFAGRPGATDASPSELARRFYYDTLVFDRRAIRYLVDMIGADRLLIGTDYPAMEMEQPAGKTLLSMSLSADVLERITWRNAFDFLGVPAPAMPSN
jgi:aminocarboxymuconate-semialdehyde decarboxylase